MDSGIKIEEKKAAPHYIIGRIPKSTQTSAGEDRSLYDVSKSHSSDIDEDYRPLPTPSHSVLRSSCSPPRSKQLRVTFQQDISNSSSNSRTFYRALSDAASPALWETNQQPLLTPTHNKSERGPTYLDSDPRPYGSDRELDSSFTDACWPTSEPGLTSMPWSLPRKSTELESHTAHNRLLQLTSDLYVVTHLPDVAIPVRSFSEEGPEQRSPRCTLSMESFLQPSKHKTQQTLSTQTTPLRQNDGAGKGLKTKEQTTLSKGKIGSCPALAFQLDGPDLCTVLRALLDLVDQHWSGPFSLHLSPSFMAKAIRLLQPLASPVRPLQSETVRNVKNRNDKQHGMEDSREWWDVWNAKLEKTEPPHEQAGVEERRCWGQCSLDFEGTEADYLKRQLAKTQNKLESLKKRLISSLKENYILRSDKRKVTACLKSELVSLDLDDHLQRESKVLQEQEELLKQLEQTVILLQSNQRSLVSHNNLLLNMIKRKPSKLGETL